MNETNHQNKPINLPSNQQRSFACPSPTFVAVFDKMVQAAAGSAASGKVDQTVDDISGGGGSNGREEEPSFFCTHAVTGDTPSFQAIYVCHDCFEEEEGEVEDHENDGDDDHDDNANNINTDDDGDDHITAADTVTTVAITVDDTVESGNEIDGDVTADADTEPAVGRRRNPLCICEGCADTCHSDHDVEYIGMGPSYCDCQRVCRNCRIYSESLLEATRLGIVVSPREDDDHKDDSPASKAENGGGDRASNMIMDAFEIRSLRNETTAQFLVDQAQELIKWTKDTHFVDKQTMKKKDETELCAFEKLAWNIYNAHRERLLEYSDPTSNDNMDDGNNGGAEWWVQVKEIATTNNGDSTSDHKERSKKTSSIDLHYDKDEALAESFGLGSFPVISTVTYLTAGTTPGGRNTKTSPTVVFDHTYTQGEEEVMSKMIVSRPRIGKHLIFDGRLLHGAPSAQYFPPSDDTTTATAQNVQSENDGVPYQAPVISAAISPLSIRVTFLVNIWKDRRPANVHVLDSTIRTRLLLKATECGAGSTSSFDVEMEQLSIPTIEIDSEDDLPDTLQHRIELPFVSKGTDIVWENELDKDGKHPNTSSGGNSGSNDVEEDTEEEDSGLVVVTFPPPPSSHDTILISFGPGMQAYLDHPQTDWDGTDETQSENGTRTKLSAKSDYV